MIRVVIADRHAMMREGLTHLLGEVPTISVISDARNGYEVLTQARAGGFDVLLLDLAMPGRSGIELIRQLKTEAPAIAILVLTMHEADSYAIPALRAGARGFLNKTTSVERLVAAIHCVASGRPFVDEGMPERLALHAAPPDMRLLHCRLTEREDQVLSGLVRGRSLTEIAHAMGISAKTVSTHKAKVLEKMGMTTVSQLVRYAVEQGLLPLPTV